MSLTKRMVSLLISALMLGGLASCSGNKPVETTAPMLSAATSQSSSASVKETPEDSVTEKVNRFGKAIVVYFSCTGTTKEVALKIASEAGCGTYEIVPSKPYTTEDLNYNNKKSRSSREQNDKKSRPEIDGNITDWDSYDTVFIGYPIWLGKAPRILCTFVESRSFEGKKVIPFCTSGSSGIGSSASELEALAQNKGKWINGTRFGASVKSSDISEWMRSLSV